MASLLLVSAASGATIVPIRGAGMTFQGKVLLEGNMLDPASLGIDGLLTLIDPPIGDPVFTLVIDKANGRGAEPKWTMFQDDITIGKGTMDTFVLLSAIGLVPTPPSVVLNVVSTAMYNGTGYVGQVSFPFSELGTSTGDVVFGPGTVEWTGITVFGDPVNHSPEPATMSLMIVGAVVMLRRKRQK
jgi:hypothetical protein